MANFNDPTPSSRQAPPLSSDEIIALYGFVVRHVGYGPCSVPGCRCTTPSSKPWSYTAGLTSLGLPELVVLGPSLDAAHHLVHAVVEARREGRFDSGTGDLATCCTDVRIVDVPDRWVLADRSRMSAWFEHYGTDGLPVVQQVLWPDRFGYFPNDVGSQPGFRKRQPLLRDHPLTYPRLEGRSSGRIRR